MSLPGIEPGTLSVLDSRDNHYTTETPLTNNNRNALIFQFHLFHDTANAPLFITSTQDC